MVKKIYLEKKIGKKTEKNVGMSQKWRQIGQKWGELVKIGKKIGIICIFTQKITEKIIKLG